MEKVFQVVYPTREIPESSVLTLIISVIIHLALWVLRRPLWLRKGQILEKRSQRWQRNNKKRKNVTKRICFRCIKHKSLVYVYCNIGMLLYCIVLCFTLFLCNCA